MTEENDKDLDVLCIGLCVVDALGRPIDEYPRKGRLALFDKMELHVGGCASATSVTLARMGANTALAGRIGKDGLGDFFLKYVGDSGVDTSHIVRDEGTSTAFTFVAISSDGDRTFFHCPGADNILSIGDVDMDLVRRARIVHIGGSLVMATLDGPQTVQVLKAAKEAGAITGLDTAYNSNAGAAGLLNDAFPLADYFFAGYDEGVNITGKQDHKEIASWLHDRGCGTVVIKLGEKGSYILSESGSVDIEAFPATVVDTCGAGDVYVGGFLYGVLQDWPVAKCGRLGALLASYSVASMGGAAGVPKIEDLGYLESLA